MVTQSPRFRKRIAAKDSGQPASLIDMVDAFGRIAEELRHQYLFAFSAPGLARASHDVKVRALRADTTTRSRRVFVEEPPVETRPDTAAVPAAASALTTPLPSGAAVSAGGLMLNVGLLAFLGRIERTRRTGE